MISHILRKFKSIYETNFILVIAVSSTAYMHSSYLKSLGTPIPEGILFAFGSILALITTMQTPKLFQRYGVVPTVGFASILNASSFLLMYLSISEIVSVLAFVTVVGSTAVLLVGLDMIIQHYSDKKDTGEVRGINLALRNLAYLVGPLIAGLIAEEFNLPSVYLFASITMFLLVLFFHARFYKLKLFPKYLNRYGFKNLVTLWKKKKLRASYLSGFIVEFFFAIWAVFLTIYMHEVVGFNWEQIGVLFAIMHIPYVILEPIIGDSLDNSHNEKFAMTIGLILMAGSLVWISVLPDKSFLPWILALCLSRIGASFGQVAHESYFFAQISKEDADSISAYRSMTPLSLLIGPFVGSIILLFTGYRELFLVTACILIITIIAATKLTHND